MISPIFAVNTKKNYPIMKKIILALSSLSLLLFFCNQERAVTDPPKTNKNTQFQIPFHSVSAKYKVEKRMAIEEFYENEIKDSYWGGILVAKNGEILFEDYQGYANFEERIKFDKDTPMHVASVGKVITAVGILQLVDKKALTLDQKVSDIIEGFPYEKITVRMLLNHRSGLPKYENFADKKLWDKKKTIYNEDVISILKNKKPPLMFTPNTKFTYCNTNYVLLASIVEKLTNKSFQQAMETLIFKPLEMNNTFVMDDLSKKWEVTQSYDRYNKRMRWDYMDGTYGDKNIYTTPRDLLKMDLALYSDKFLSKELKTQMFKGYSYEKIGKKNYGLGIRMVEPTYADDDLFTFHNGWWRGNKPSYITLRKDTVTIICFDNRNTAKAYKAKHLAKEFGRFSFLQNDEE